MDYSVVRETITCKPNNQWRLFPQLNPCSDSQSDEVDKLESIKPRRDKAVKRLPLFLHKGGRRLQYAWDGHRLRMVDDKFCVNNLSCRGLPNGWLENCVDNVGKTLKAIFVPENVRPNYMVYLRWKCLHRIFSSALQVQCTQAMLRAVGIGAKRALPSAAALNWVLKDGLGRLGRLMYTARLGRTFDSDLKKVRFSTSVVFSMSLGLELLTPKYPEKFLLLATIANVAKSISLAAYLATSSTIHRSFALTDNLADISAKSQAQTVVLDNLGLGLAACMNHLCKQSKRVEKILPLLTFPIFCAIDLFALYHQLQSVQFSTLNKARLEIVVRSWLKTGMIPSVEQVNKEEVVQLLSSRGRNSLPLMIGAPKIRNYKPENILALIKTRSSEQHKYLLLKESYRNCVGIRQNRLLLWPHREAVAEDVILGVLQACYLQVDNEDQEHSMGDTSCTGQSHNDWDSQAGALYVNSMGSQSQYDEGCIRWDNALQKSQIFAQENIHSLLAEMEGAGWLLKHVLLSTNESVSYSTD